MSAILSGSLRSFPTEALLRFLMSAGTTGTLRAGSVACEVVFRDGSPVFARLDREASIAPATAPDPQAEVEEALIELLQLDDGTFEVDESADAPEGAVGREVDLARLAAAAATKKSERLATRRLFENPASVAYVISVHDVSKITVAPDEYRLLFRIGSAKLVTDIVRESGGDAAAVYALLQKLVEQNLIEVRIPTMATAEQAAPGAEASTEIGCLTLEDEARTSYPLFEDVYTIGRDATNSIQIADGSISGSHARIVRAPGGYAIEDLDSRNGSFVNGRRITRELLENNDSIRLGKVFLTFNTAEQDLDRTKANRKLSDATE